MLRYAERRVDLFSSKRATGDGRLKSQIEREMHAAHRAALGVVLSTITHAHHDDE